MQRCRHCGQHGPRETHCPARKSRRCLKERQRTPQMRFNLHQSITPAEAPWYIDCPKSERYHYKTFDDRQSVRIMVLLPGGHKKPIRCKLRTVPIRDAPRYEAISYGWGERRGAILCDGKRLEVPLNLAHALIRFRHKTESCLLWADAVCINQNNITERGHQVQMMGDVFRNAGRVLVWLGRDGEVSAKKMFDFVNACFPLPPWNEVRARFYQGISEDRELVQDWKSFFQNDWFTRMWIVQEIGLASEAMLYCGEASVEWEILAVVCYALGANTFDIFAGHDLSSLVWVIQLWAQDFQGNRFASKSTTICEVLIRNRLQICSNDRDRIYALLGHHIFKNNLSNPTSPFYLSVDYEVSLAELYTEVCQKVVALSKSRPLYILALVQHDPSTIKHFSISSWVPSWNRTPRGIILDHDGNPSFTADGQQCIQPVFRVDAGKMLDMVSFGIPPRFAWVQALVSRRVFVTSRGWVGIGPEVTSVGNEVCVLFGSPTPMVVWELPSAGEKLVRLCGESYVHGIMHGEAVEAMEAGEFEETTFNII